MRTEPSEAGSNAELSAARSGAELPAARSGAELSAARLDAELSAARPGTGLSAAEPGLSAAGSDADRMARVALTWLAEPGNRAVWMMVQALGAVATLDRLLGGDIPVKSLRGTVEARMAAG